MSDYESPDLKAAARAARDEMSAWDDRPSRAELADDGLSRAVDRASMAATLRALVEDAAVVERAARSLASESAMADGWSLDGEWRRNSAYWKRVAHDTLEVALLPGGFTASPSDGGEQ